VLHWRAWQPLIKVQLLVTNVIIKFIKSGDLSPFIHIHQAHTIFERDEKSSQVTHINLDIENNALTWHLFDD
jgi:hypothetical protein